MQVIALADGYDDLRKVLIARRKELGLTQLDVDEIAGLQSGYTGKLECRARNFGPMSLGSLLGALGVGLAIVTKEDMHPAVARALARRSATRAPAGEPALAWLTSAADMTCADCPRGMNSARCPRRCS